MKYYIEILENIITSKGTTVADAELNKGQIEVTEEFYNTLQVPSTFELDEQGQMINITPSPQLEPEVIDEIIDDEKIAMAEAIIDLNMRIEELENRLLNGGA